MGRHPKDYALKQALPALVIVILLVGTFYIGLEIGSRKINNIFFLRNAKDSILAKEIKISEQTYSEDQATYKISFTYPQISGLPSVSLQNEVNTLLKESFKENLAAFKTDEKEEQKFSIAAGEKNEFTATFETLKITPLFLSIRYNVSEYMAGAAHPSGYIKIINLDLEQAKILKNSDIFQGQWLNYLSDYCAKALEAQNANEAKDLKEWIIQGTEPTENNFLSIGFSGSQAIVYFNPYQVAPYAQGTSNVQIPLELLEPYILSNYYQRLK